MRCLSLFFLLLLLGTGPAVAQVDEDLARSYVEQAHLDVQIQQIAGQFGQQLQGATGQLPEPARQPFLEVFGEALSEDALQTRLAAYVAAEADPESLRAALEWLEDPAVQEMQALEMATSEDPNAQVALQMYAMSGQFGSFEVSEERQTLMDRYMEVTEADEAAVDLYLDIIVAMSTSMSALAEEPPSADSIRAQVRPQLESMVGGMARGSLLYAYRDISDEQISTYVERLEAPPAQYHMDFSMEALSATLTGALQDAGSEFVQILRDLDEAGEIDLDAMRGQGESREVPAEEETVEDDG